MNRPDPDRSAGLWLLSFTAAAGAALCGRFGWLPALLGGVLGALAFRLRLNVGKVPAAVRTAQTIWLAAPLCAAANGAAALFPDGSGSLYIPAAVLALSWLLSRRRTGGVLACCAIVGFFVLGALGFVSACALPELRLRWLAPEFSWEQMLAALAVGSGGMLLAEAVPDIRPGVGWRLAAAVCPAALAALVSGCLSRPLAARQASAFYTLSRAVSLSGVAERFEALIAACLTLGACSVCALLLCAAWGGSKARAALALAALTLTRLPLPMYVLTAGTALFWYFLPLIFAQKPMRKKVKKR